MRLPAQRDAGVVVVAALSTDAGSPSAPPPHGAPIHNVSVYRLLALSIGVVLWALATIACASTELTLVRAQELINEEFGLAGVEATRVHNREGGERALARIEVAGGADVAAGWAEFARLAKGGWIIIDVEYGPPAGLPKLLSVEQRQTRTDMQRIGAANAAMNRDLSRFAETLTELNELGYLDSVVTHDAWGNAIVYVTGPGTYTVASFGCDGAAGPRPPTMWINEPCAPDLMMLDGVFIQMPTGQ